MLVTRHAVDTGRNTWSSSKLDALYNAASPRMSNFEPLSTQPDWREQYSAFPLSGDNGLLQQSFDQTTNPNVSDSTQEQNGSRQALEHRHSLGPLRQEPESIIERPDSAPGDFEKTATGPTRDDSLVSVESAALSLGSVGSNPLSSASSAPVQQGTLANETGGVEGEVKDEDDELEDDEEMIDGELEEGAAPQTAAERRAERRKMKRFR